MPIFAGVSRRRGLTGWDGWNGRVRMAARGASGACRRRCRLARGLAIVAAAASAGCASISEKFADTASQLPGDRPARRRAGAAGQPGGLPAVHDIPPPRNSVMLTNIEQQKLEDDLADAPAISSRARSGVAACRPKKKQGSRSAGHGQGRAPPVSEPTAGRSTSDAAAKAVLQGPLRACYEARESGSTRSNLLPETDDGRILPHQAPAALRVRDRSTAPRRRPATPAPTSSISAWATRTCRRPRMSSRR